MNVKHEYIEREAALTITKMTSGDHMTAFSEIRQIPAADVVEVVHGVWEEDPDMVRMDGHIYDYRCSRCHSMAVEGCYNNNDRFTNFCPNCGAKMDGERKEV